MRGPPPRDMPLPFRTSIPPMGAALVGRHGEGEGNEQGWEGGEAGAREAGATLTLTFPPPWRQAGTGNSCTAEV